ncbi:MAG: hypothetical protein JWO98_2241 [Frankiales bacterium]|nr:hypothetical protein [Frankiales bacterium]
MTDPWLDREQRREALVLAWGSLTRSQRKKVAVVEYFCKARSCSLLTVFRSPEGLFVALPRYRNSPERNAATSVEAARVTRTVDGDRRWKPRVGPLEEFAQADLPTLGLDLNCDHYSGMRPGPELLSDVRQGRPGNPFVRRF